MQIKLGSQHRDIEQIRSRIINGIERNSGYSIEPHDFRYISSMPMLRIKDRYPYRLEGKQDIKAFLFNPYIFNEGENKSIDPCGRQGENNLISRALEETNRQS